jgi:hypothetical protein
MFVSVLFCPLTSGVIQFVDCVLCFRVHEFFKRQFCRGIGSKSKTPDVVA